MLICVVWLFVFEICCGLIVFVGIGVLLVIFGLVGDCGFMGGLGRVVVVVVCLLFMILLMSGCGIGVWFVSVELGD